MTCGLNSGQVLFLYYEVWFSPYFCVCVCVQVGAPPEIVCVLDEIRREKDLCKQDAVSMCLGVDPELDEFMVSLSSLSSLSLYINYTRTNATHSLSATQKSLMRVHSQTYIHKSVLFCNIFLICTRHS